MNPVRFATAAAAGLAAVVMVLAAPVASAQIIGGGWAAAEDVASDLGLAFTHSGFNGAGDLPLFEETAGGGACWGDVDADGRLDLYIPNGVDTQTVAKGRLFRNTGSGFTDVTDASGTATIGNGQACAFGDFDNDGYPDLFVTFAIVDISPASLQTNVLFHNDGDGTFTDVTQAAGVSGQGHAVPCIGGSLDVTGADPNLERCWSTGAAWLDYDNDGDLDLYVAQYVESEAGNDCVNEGVSMNPSNCRGQPNRLYRNNGDGSFTEVGSTLGVHVNEDAGARGRGHSLGVVAADIDRNGWIDLYVTNDEDANALYLNSGAAFTSAAGARGVANEEAGMGVDANDYNNDGRVDLLSTHLQGLQYDAVYRQNGDGSFTNVHDTIGVTENGHTRWGGGFVDFNNDGWKDLLIVTGHQTSGAAGPAYYYLFNPSTQAYELVQEDSDIVYPGTGVDGTWANQRAAAFADYDNDGDTDVAVVALQDNEGNAGVARLVRFNVLGAGSDDERNPWRDNQWLGLQLVGRTTNRDAVGAVVKVTAGDLTMWQQRTSGGSYGVTHDPRLRFGLGATATSATVEVTWPATPGCEAHRTQTVNLDSAQLNRYNVIREACDLAPSGVAIAGTKNVDHQSVTLRLHRSFAPDFGKYVVAYSNVPDFDAGVAAKHEVTDRRGTTPRIGGLLDGTDYYFRVAVQDEAGQSSGFGATFHAKTTALPPAAVALGSPTNISTTGLDVAWSASSSGTFARYELFQGLAASFVTDDATRLATFPAKATTSTHVPNLLDATTYYFVVKVVNADGAVSPASNEVSATTLNAAPPALEVVTPTGDALTNDRAVVRWNATALHDFARYEVALRQVGAEWPTTGDRFVTVVNESQSFHAFQRLPDNTAHQARVVVVDGGGLASPPTVVNFTTRDAPPPPVTLEPFLPAALGATNATASWSASGIQDFSHYKLDVATDAAFGNIVFTVNITQRATTRHDVTGLQDFVAYHARISTFDATGSGAPSDVVAFRTANAAPAPLAAGPSLLFGPPSDRVTFTWPPSDAHDFAAYELHLGGARDFTPAPATRAATVVDRDATTRAFVGVTGTQFARVVVVDAGGLRAASPAVAVIAGAAPSAPELKATSPAPLLVRFTFTFPSDVTHVTGLTLRRAGDTTNEPLAVLENTAVAVDVRNLPGGERACFELVARSGGYEVVSEPACVVVKDGSSADARGALLVQHQEAAANDRAVTLAWWSPETTEATVFLRAAGEAPRRVPGTPTATPFEDGVRYELVARALKPATAYAWFVNATATDGFAADSATHDFVTAVDTFPPGVVARLNATRSVDGTHLKWAPSVAVDTAGYLVYRSVGDEPFTVVGAVLAPKTRFVDAPDVLGEVRYRVVALDHAQNGLPVAQAAEIAVIAASVVTEEVVLPPEDPQRSAPAPEGETNASLALPPRNATSERGGIAGMLETPAPGLGFFAAALVAAVVAQQRGLARRPR